MDDSKIYETATFENEVKSASDVITAETPVVQNKKPLVVDASGNVFLNLLSKEEIAKYNEIGKSLQTQDLNSITSFGGELQSVMGRYSNDFLENVRTSNIGEVGTLIDNLLGELSVIDLDELDNTSGFKKFLIKIPILNKLVANVEKVAKKYDTIAKKVDDISSKISATRVISLRDNAALERMFQSNKEYGSKIEEYIIAGKLRLEEISKELEMMNANADKYEAYEIKDLQDFANNLDRKITDLITLRHIIKQSLPQIRVVQYNNAAIAAKAQTIIATTIPLWRNQLAMTVSLQSQKTNIDIHKKITQTTNDLIRKNSQILKQNSIDVAKSTEESVVSIETLRATTNEFISMVTEVKKIQQDGYAKRREVENEIMQLSKQLDNITMQQITN